VDTAGGDDRLLAGFVQLFDLIFDARSDHSGSDALLKDDGGRRIAAEVSGSPVAA